MSSDEGQLKVRTTPVLNVLDKDTTYGDFRDDLARDGYCVIKNVISQEKAAQTVDQIHEWLESFNLGYKRDDPSTIREDCLPVIHQKGLIQAYGAPHENFTWSIRGDENVIKVFETLYGTEDLLTSFDAVNVSLPNRKDLPANKPWAHQDQDPEHPGLRCVQGFVNLLPNGDNDGGLVVLKRGHEVSEEYHRVFKDEERGFRWTNEMYVFKETGLDWLKEQGYEWVKVNCGPGDMVLWDSRTPHFNKSPTEQNGRFVVYTCMLPVSIATQEELQRKKECFENSAGHSHWPNCLQPFITQFITPQRDGKACPYNTWKPRKFPELSERAYRITGIPYIRSEA